MDKILMFKDTQKIKEFQDYLEGFIPSIEEIVKDFNAFEIGDFNTKDLLKIIDKVEFIKNRIIENVDKPTVHGVAITKHAFKDMLQLPDGYGKFIQKVEQLIGKVDNGSFDRGAFIKSKYTYVSLELVGHRWDPFNVMLAFFEVVNDKVLISSKPFARFEESNIYNAETTKEIELFNAINKVVIATNEALPILKNYQNINSLECFPGTILKNGTYVVDCTYIKSKARI
jgi:hypothetical protein